MAQAVTLTPIPLFARALLRFGQLVGLCVLIAAVSVLTSVVAYVADAVRMHSWTPVEARIQSAEYVHVEGKAGPQVRAAYRYHYDGVEYDGTRVDVGDGVELVGDFQRQMAAELSAHAANGTPATAFMNSARPEESVLYPRFYWTVFAVRLALFLVLALFGVALFWGLGHSLRRFRRLERRSKEHPNEPWLWRADWAGRRIGSTSHTAGLIYMAVGLFYLLVVLPVALFVLVEWEREITSWPGIVLLVVGLMMFNMTRYGMKKRRRFGRAELRLSTPTGVIGGALAGVATIPYKFHTDKPFRVSLECAAKVQGSESGNRETIEWRTTTLLAQTLDADDPHTTTVPIYVAIDYECQPWDWSKGVGWRLKVGPDEEPFEHFAEFEVPVFRTADSSPDFVPDPVLLQPYVAKVDAERALGSMCRRELLFDGTEQLRFSYFSGSVAAIAAVMLAVMVAAAAAIVHFDFHVGWTIFPGMLGLVLVFGMGEMLVWGSRIEIRPGELTVVAGYAPFRKRRLVSQAAGQRIQVEAYKELQMERHDWYGVRLRIETPEDLTTPGGLPLTVDDEDDLADTPLDEHDDEPPHYLVECVTIVRRLRNQAEAEVVRDWLSAKVRLEDQATALKINVSETSPSNQSTV